MCEPSYRSKYTEVNKMGNSKASSTKPVTLSDNARSRLAGDLDLLCRGLPESGCCSAVSREDWEGNS